MKKLAPVLLMFLLLGCRGEKVPRDYQNMPPAVSHPVDAPSEAPSREREIGIPEPSTGPQGTAGPYEPVAPTPTTT
jgi:hypothetical protein